MKNLDAVQGLDATLVVLAELRWVGVDVVGGHHRAVSSGVLQPKSVSELMNGHLQQVCT